MRIIVLPITDPRFLDLNCEDDEAMDMIRVIGKQIGFIVDGRIYVYSTEPEIPPPEKAHGYYIKFTPYDENA